MATATHFVALALPILLTHRTILISGKGGPSTANSKDPTANLNPNRNGGYPRFSAY